MNTIPKFPFFLFSSLLLILIVTLSIRTGSPVLLHPEGEIGEKQKDLMILATQLMLIVVIPVFILIFLFAWKYRADNAKAEYNPNWDRNHQIELIWWGLPLIIVTALSVITWKKTRELDPFVPIPSDKKPIEIRVIALQWKWLFLYPEYDIATVNRVCFPEKTPIRFVITADAPMNSFWIPKMGGQIYAMPGMKSCLHLIADQPGTFRGSSAQLSGVGFAGMVFPAVSQTEEDFQQWVNETKQAGTPLELEEYKQLSLPSENNPPAAYHPFKKDLYDWVIMKYMQPQ